MRRILPFRLGTRDVHLPKLLGAFLMVAAFLMLLQSFASMFESWDSVKTIHACIQAANSGTVSIQDCQTQAYYAFQILLNANQYQLTDTQIATGLLPHVAAVFIWIGVFIIGMVIYRTWKIMLPIEENTFEAPRWKRRKK